ncbi:MAG: RusA family crossover junction endodeoxyribonuclease [Planctomycetaceae bacterium]|nr:RusA family crossover junction endodeoxyribonuclease [Planctomycetaceae bacterium]
MSVTISLPWPPSTNHYWGNRIIFPRQGKPFVSTYLTARAKEFQNAVEARILHRFGRIRPLDCRLAVTIVANVPDRRTRDLSNLLKATEDALTHCDVWTDDGLIDRITIERGTVKKGGELLVTIEKIPDPQPSLFGGK